MHTSAQTRMRAFILSLMGTTRSKYGGRKSQVPCASPVQGGAGLLHGAEGEGGAAVRGGDRGAGRVAATEGAGGLRCLWQRRRRMEGCRVI